ncbi:MAG: hypothetical protein NC217_02295 [Muribaculaceae bacterium]|nr:hypothetical protein [Muribaculaceae bacterium]
MLKRNLCLLLMVLSAIAGFSSIVNSSSVKGRVKKTTKQTPNTPQTPDFAFPQTVINNAETELRQAFKTGNDESLIQCAIQLVIANDAISNERMPQMAQLLDSLARQSSTAVSAVLYSVEAELYQEVYMDSRWQFDQRKLPLETYPADPQQWDRQLFAKKVLSLINQSLENSDILNNISSQTYQQILSGYTSSAAEYYPTLYSLLSKRSLEILSPFANKNGTVIPFGGGSTMQDPTQLCAIGMYEIANRWYEFALASGNVAAISAGLKALCDYTPGMTGDKLFNTYIKAYDQYKDSPYSADFLVYANATDVDDANKEKLYILIEGCIAQHPDAPRANNLINILNDAKSGYGNIKLSSIFSPRQEVMAEVNTENMPANLYACILKVPISDNPSAQFKAGKGRLVVSRLIDVTTDTTKVNFGKLQTGDYIILISDDTKGNNYKKYGNDYRSFKVTNFSFNTQYDNDRVMVQLIDPMDGKPWVGKQVFFTDNSKAGSRTVNAITGEYGLVEIPGELRNVSSVKYTVKDGNDVVSGTTWRRSNSSRTTDKNAVVLTDLALFHPGDTCHFSVILFNNNYDTSEQRALKNQKILARLRNASYVECDSIELMTDEFGRATGQFVLPKDGMNGKFCILIYENNNSLAQSFIQVEEYKQPTFYVELDNMKSIVPPEALHVSGKVMTYSGMPVADADVKLTIELRPSWWMSYMDGSYALDTTTDSDGKFNIDLSTDLLVNTNFENRRYCVSAVATSSAGESQQSESKNVYIGGKSYIKYTGAETINIDNPQLTLKYELVGDDDSSEPIEYCLTDRRGVEVMSGESTSLPLTIDASDLTSGTYTIRVSMGDFSTTDRLILYRLTDKVPAKQTPLWIPERQIVASSGSNTVTVPVGSAAHGTNIYYVVSDEKRVLNQGLLLPDHQMLNLNVPSPVTRNSRIWVNFSTMDSCIYYSGSVTVIPDVALKDVTVEKLSFRDKINAGGHERWTFRYTLDNKPLANLPIIATMTDKSLNAITPFNWRRPNILTPQPIISLNHETYNHGNSIYFYYNPYKSLPIESFPNPNINQYGKVLYGRVLNLYGYRSVSTTAANGMVMEESMDYAAPMMMAKMSAADTGAGTTNEVADEVGEAESDVSVSENKPTNYRPAEMPLVWFKPNLATNENGVLELSFDAPDYNTTWQLQMLGYTPSMLSNLLQADIVASKPVMVSTNSPRFLRTGDNVYLTATVYNNSDNAAKVGGSMEIFNPIDDKLIVSKDFPVIEVAPMGSRLLVLEFTVPSNVEFIGYRTLGTVPGFSDGEQSLISIQPSSSPVTESYPFYIAPASSTYTMKLPAMATNEESNTQVSLQYCDNPIWECVTALPDLSFDKDASILSTVNRLYGNSIAAGLIKQYPQIADAIKMWHDTDDTTFVSNLQKNEELKVVALDNTPWVLNAQAETLRKTRLINLLDQDNCLQVIDDAINKLKSEQTSQGGWSWCPGMDPSQYITGQVLWRLAMLHEMGYLDMDKANTMITAALHYCDSELYKDYIRAKKNFSTSQMLNYMYIRSFFPTVKMSADFAGLKKKAMATIKEEWKQFGIYDKATAATLFYREKEPMQARTILESLNQFASKSAERGMWFDNLRSGVLSNNTLITTTQVLEAYNEISPGSESVDQLRQWLIIERQAQDWGADAQLAEVVYAILTSGTDWTDTSQAARIYLNDKEITPAQRDNLTGAFTIVLEPSQASDATLRIEKFGEHQSWGGVIAKYIAPIDEVKEFSESDVAISKRLLVVDENNNGTSVRPIGNEPITVGQHIRVQLTVSSTRDIDYAVITDERSGCMMPDNQLSHYVWQDGIGYYCEVKNDATNLFIPRLPKGDFIIEYDCHVSQEGTFTTGIATLQSLYAPSLSAHTAGSQLTTTN